MNFTVFISHSMKDANLVNTLFSYLKQSGIDAVTSQSFDPTLRRSIQEQIKDLIRRADCVLAFLTHSDKNRDTVYQEIGVARAYNMMIVPIVERGIDLPGSLKDLRYIVYDRDNPWDTAQNISQYAQFLKTAKEQEERKRSMGMGLAALFFALLLFTAFAEE